MIFYILLAAAACLGACLWTLLSHRPGRLRGSLFTGLLLALSALALFFGAVLLLAGTREPRAALDRFFPDQLSKLTGCALLFLLCAPLGLAAGSLRSGGLRPFFRRVLERPLRRRVGLALVLLPLLMSLGCTLLAGTLPPSPLRLSELCCANFTLLPDPDSGDYCDYLEIINTGEETVDLAGYFLSDNGKKRGRFRLPSLLLEPGGSALLWADGSGKSGQRGGTDIHLNFSLDPGETIWFSSPSGILLDRVTVPERTKNISLSLVEGEWVLARGTPGAGNEDALLYKAPSLEAPVFSLPSGFYAEDQLLTLSAAPGTEIRYTLDGALPTAESPLYEGPLTLTDISDQPNQVLNHPSTTLDRSGVVTEPVDKATLLRAAAFDAEGNFSRTVTAVYFVGERFARYGGKSVLNITAAPNDLFGDYGIAVTGIEYDRWLAAGAQGQSPWPSFYAQGRIAERDAVVSLFDPAGSLRLEEACGVRLQGGSSRAGVYKRFRLISRGIYSGSYCFSAPIFGALESHSFFTRQDAADVIAQKLSQGLNLGGLDAVPAAVFVNGEFYCDSWLRERYDKQYFQSHYGADPEELILIRDDKLDLGTEADYEAYRALMDYIAGHDCADPAVYAEICRQIDVESCAAYFAFNLYCNNSDWSLYKNYRLWRTRSAEGQGALDGRWRWLVYDMDACYWTRSAFQGADRASYDLFRYPAPYTGEPFLEMPLFRDLLENPEFKALFTRTWLELMNLRLTPERARTVLEELGVTDDSFWISFLSERPAYAADILIDALELPGQSCALALSVSDPAGGSLRLNGAAVSLSEEGWKGVWISGVPLALTAEPAPGWRFVGWQGAEGTAPNLELSPGGDLTVTAVFERK